MSRVERAAQPRGTDPTPPPGSPSPALARLTIDLHCLQLSKANPQPNRLHSQPHCQLPQPPITRSYTTLNQRTGAPSTQPIPDFLKGDSPIPMLIPDIQPKHRENLGIIQLYSRMTHPTDRHIRLNDPAVEITRRNIIVSVPKPKPQQARNRKLNDEVALQANQLRTAGQTYRQIREWLHAEHGIDITISSLSKHFLKLNQLNQAVAQAIYIDSAVQGAEQITEMLDEHIVALNRRSAELYQAGLFNDARMHQETLLKYMSKRFDMASLHKKEDVEATDTTDIDELLREINPRRMQVDPLELSPAEQPDQLQELAEAENHLLYQRAQEGKVG